MMKDGSGGVGTVTREEVKGVKDQCEVLARTRSFLCFLAGKLQEFKTGFGAKLARSAKTN